MRKKLIYLVALFGAFAVACSSPSTTVQAGEAEPTAPPTESVQSETELALADLVSKSGVPSMSWAGLGADGEIVSGATGFADVASQAQPAPETAYLLGSVSKPVLATVVMTLVEDGRVELDTDINTYLDFGVDNPLVEGELITLRTLLTHTSAIVDAGATYEAAYSFEGDSTIGLEEFLRSYLVEGGERYNPIENFASTAPGDSYSYSNVGAGLVGLVVESVTGQPLHEVAIGQLFDPLGMQNSQWRFDAFADGLSVATPYTAQTGGYEQIGPVGHPLYPDGGLRSSPTDLAKWLAALADGGGPVLGPDTVESMLSDGLFWEVEGDFVSHTGLDYGAISIVVLHRPTGVGFAAAINSDQIIGQSVLLEAATLWFAEAGLEYLHGNNSDDGETGGGGGGIHPTLETAASGLPGDVVMSISQNGEAPETRTSSSAVNETSAVPLAGATTTALAVVALSLQAEGSLGLATPVVEQLVGHPLADQISPQIRLVDLLSHTSGLGLLADTPAAATVEELLAATDLLAMSSQPGTQFEFRDTNNLVAGEVLAHVSEAPLAELLQTYVFGPAAMQDSFLVESAEQPFVDGYTQGAADGPVPTGELGDGVSFAGQIAFSAPDLVRFQQALATEQLLPKDLVGQMQVPVTADSYGLGLADVSAELGIPGYSMPGDAVGYQSLSVHTADGSVVVAIVANDSFIDMNAVAEEFLG